MKEKLKNILCADDSTVYAKSVRRNVGADDQTVYAESVTSKSSNSFMCVCPLPQRNTLKKTNRYHPNSINNINNRNTNIGSSKYKYNAKPRNNR